MFNLQRYMAYALIVFTLTLTVGGGLQPAAAATNAQNIEFLLSQVRQASGPLTGGKVYAYASGTSTPKTIWLDRGKQTPAANPYTLDSNGTAQLFGDGLYRIVIKTAAGVTVYDRSGLAYKDASGLAYDVADYASLAAAVTAIGSTRATLQYSTDQTLSANLNVPATLELMPLNGAIINHGAYTISYAGSTARWPLAQVFNGTGAVSFSNTAAIVPEWFYGTDSVKVQTAVASAAASGWTPLAINRKYTVDAITIDRVVDATSQEFRIIGSGLDAGFHTTSTGPMFTSTIANVADPVSEHISFEDIRFSTSDSAIDNHVVDGNKFLRMKFINCYFYGIRLATTDQYYQTYSVISSYLIGWAGTFLESTDGGRNVYAGQFINVNFVDFKAEFGSATDSKVIKAAKAFASGNLNMLAENFKGPAIEVYAFTGSHIYAGHYEGIEAAAIKLGTTNSLSLQGNTFVSGDSNWYAVDCETSLNVTSSGNYSSSNLFNDDNMIKGYGEGLTSTGDSADGNLYKDIKNNHLKQTGTLTGFTVDPVTFWYVSRNGTTITLSSAAVSGTSDAATMTLTGVIPTKWLPNVQRSAVVHVTDNGAITAGLINIGPSGVTFSKDTQGNAFTASGTKGVMPFTISYSIGTQP